MIIVCKKSFLCFIIVISGVIAVDNCRNDAKCINIKNCKGLYASIQNNLNDQLRTTLRRYHCGFDENKSPMVCCPPTLREDPAGLLFKEIISSPADLLPDLKVCGIQNNDRIVGGTQTELDEHPWMALIKYDKPKGSGYYCGGVLIASRYVMTASHCVKGADIPPNWKLSAVRLGEWNATSKIDCYFDDCSPPVQDIPVEKVIAHEDYNPTDGQQQNDIALLRLSKEAQFTEFVKPICLPMSAELRRQSFNGYDMEVAGWGKTESASVSNIKLKVRVPVINPEECQEIYNRAGRTISSKQLCAGGLQGQDSCRGDSGGPLMGQVPSMENWIVVGVVSYGPSPCGTAGWPGVYTRVSAFIDWILSKIEP